MTEIPDDLRYDPREMKARGYGPEAVAEAARASEARAMAMDLIAGIHAAFPPLPKPMVTFSVARAYDDEWILSPRRVEELRARDPETNWHEVTDEAMETHQEYFTFADPEGRLFYLPAFLCHALRAFPYVGHDAVYRALVNGYEDFGNLTPAQRHCTDRFLELYHLYCDV